MTEKEGDDLDPFVTTIIELLAAMTDSERVEVFEAIPDYFCMKCGMTGSCICKYAGEKARTL